MSSDASTVTETSRPPLDDVMLAMDVVDTLRRRERLVQNEFDETGRQEDLKQRLRKIYAAQGIDVPDHVIEQGVQALKEDRFTYKPPPDNFNSKLAKIYVRRGKWGKWVLGALSVPIIAITINYFTTVVPNAGLPDDLQNLHDEITELAKSEHARKTAEQFLYAGKSALSNEDTDKAKATIKEMQAMRTLLAQQYTIRIVNRPGIKSGVWRIPDINTRARNYYIIVEAIDPSGNRINVPIKNEETGKTSRVDIWGLRVDKQVFDSIARDKRDDGIIQRDRFGFKERGYLIPSYEMQTTGGAITAW